jgi:hypothetical protein
MKRAMWLLILSACGPFALADDLGRLFFSSTERQALDEARAAAKLPALTTPSVSREEVALLPELASAPKETVTVNGLVSRTGGPNTVWVNGQSLAPGAPGAGITSQPIEMRDGAVEFMSVQDRPHARVKPGQTYDPAAARVREAYEQSIEPP